MRDWLKAHGSVVSWNVVLVSGPARHGTFSYAPDVEVGLVSRAPLQEKFWTPDRLPAGPPVGSDIVNVRALMSSPDSLLDLRILAENGVLEDHAGRLGSADINDMDARVPPAARLPPTPAYSCSTWWTKTRTRYQAPRRGGIWKPRTT